MENSILLSICIPTYNRSKELLRLLGEIQIEIDQLGTANIVDVIVRDNSENNETERKLVVAEFAGKPWLDYKKNASNIGFDNNILNLFCEAKGDYVWLVGDDDIIFKGSIVKVIDLIKLNPDILHLPFRQPQDLIHPQYQITPRIKYWTSISGAVEQILKYIKITSFVLKKKDILLNKEKLIKLYSETGWMHLVLAFEVLMNSNQICTITLSEFFGGSHDKEWKIINWTPTAALAAKKLFEHEIFSVFDLRKQIKKFELDMYLGGISLTLFVTSGIWSTNVPLNEYFDFGAKYPFRVHLFLKPKICLMYVIIKLKLGHYFNHFIRVYQRAQLVFIKR